ncbi:hypothetical protein NQZ68_002507 [Dissostichus eleginoides]|nr:hypothetical protein NQZ68_002507 [Dissostichus eleginoides]
MYTGGNLWWKLLLPAVYRIKSVRITTRIEHPERLDSAEILIGNSIENNGSNNPSCAVVTSIPARELAAPSPSFSAVVSGRGIVVVEKKLCWSDALFYCRDFYWDLLSIRSEEEQKEVDEVLRTASFSLTQPIWVGLRRYLMDSMWFWMSGTSVNYSYWKTHSPSQISSPCGGVDTSDPFHWTDFPCGDHLYFICLTDFQEEDKRVTFYSSTRP